MEIGRRLIVPLTSGGGDTGTIIRVWKYEYTECSSVWLKPYAVYTDSNLVTFERYE
jgi:hypothetical protein